MGIGQESFPCLLKLDELSDRFIDNAGFMHVDDIASVDDASLYRQLLNEFPEWLGEAEAKGLTWKVSTIGTATGASGCSDRTVHASDDPMAIDPCASARAPSAGYCRCRATTD